MLRAVDQWMAVGVREFMLDGSAKIAYSGDIPKLVNEVRARGGRMYVEGHPRDSKNNIRWDHLAKVDGSVATHYFMVHFEPLSLSWTVPADSTMMVFLSEMPIPEAPERETPTQADVDSYRGRGFTILSSRPEFDHFVASNVRPQRHASRTRWSHSV